MQRSVQYLILLLLLISLAGCGTATHAQNTAPATHPLTRVDWKNFTYTTFCYGEEHEFHAKNGKATDNGITFQIYNTPVYGDLTGDGHVEAAISYSCTGADFGGVRLLVYSGHADHPVLLGELPQPLKNQDGSQWGSVEKTTIEQSTITLTGLGYSANTPRCCPDLKMEAQYQWNGKAFVIL